MNDHFLWTELYRPKKVEDTILTPQLKIMFAQFVKDGKIPNLLLLGPAGIGKTTIARAMLEELGADYIIINGSMNGNIDTLRYEILNFASSVSLHGGRKYVILDEADYLNANSTQPALRNFMEEFSKNCGFILTANFPKKIIEPLHSRCSVIDFKITKKDIAKLAGQFFKLTCDILDKQKIEYEKQVVVEIVSKHFPDCRRILNELQTYSATGKIDSGILINLQAVSIDELIKMLKEKKFTDIRKWVGETLEDHNAFFRQFYDNASKYFKMSYIPLLVITIAKYQYQAAFAVDQDINTMAFLVEVMVEAEFA